MNTEATIKQKEIYKYIKKYIVSNGYSPTLREIGEQFQFTVKCSFDHLKALERKGYIDRKAGSSRTIRLLKG